jgi:hypothetical protein
MLDDEASHALVSSLEGTRADGGERSKGFLDGIAFCGGRPRAREC